MSDKSYISFDIADALIERPISFSVGRRHFVMYPLTLGKMHLVARIAESLGVTDGKDSVSIAKTISISKSRRDDCLRLVAYSTLKGNECLDETLVRKRLRQLRRIKDNDLACLVIQVLTYDKTSDIISHFEIDKERTGMDKVLKSKEGKSNSVAFGGKSIWGTLIDFVCERYGWSFQYVLWDISYTNLQLLVADHVKNLFLTDEEKKKSHVSTDGVVIDASKGNALSDFVKTQSWK